MDMKAFTPAIGMEVSGIDLANVSDADAGALRDALIDRKVLVFRNQPITSHEYVRFIVCRCAGCAGNNGHIVLGGERTGFRLVTKQGQGLRPWSHERKPRVMA